MTAMTIAFWRRPRDHPGRTDGVDELTAAKIQLARVEDLAAQQARVSDQVRDRIAANHFSAAIEEWITTHVRRRT